MFVIQLVELPINTFLSLSLSSIQLFNLFQFFKTGATDVSDNESITHPYIKNRFLTLSEMLVWAIKLRNITISHKIENIKINRKGTPVPICQIQIIIISYKMNY